MSATIKILPAYNGDSILIRFLGNDNRYHNVLIDGGIARTYYRNLKPEILKIQKLKERIDLLVVSHIDDDHLDGILEFFKDNAISKDIVSECWFNAGDQIKIPHFTSTKISVAKAINLKKHLGNNFPWSKSTKLKLQKFKYFGAELILLSPDSAWLEKYANKWEKQSTRPLKISSAKSDYKKTIEELSKIEFTPDHSPTNGSSIAFLFKYLNKKVLFTADAHPSVLISSLKKLGFSSQKRLELDYMQLPHHGSKRNLNYELLEIIDCANFFISTNGATHKHPHKTALARVLCAKNRAANINFIFNYCKEPPLSNIFTTTEQEKYSFNMSFPKLSQNGYLIKL